MGELKRERPIETELRRAEDRARSTPAKRAGEVLEHLNRTPRPTPSSRHAPPLPGADFMEELRRRSPTIADAVDLAGGLDKIDVDAFRRAQAAQPPPDVEEGELVALEPWAPHTFPEKRRDGRPRYLQRKVCRATRSYTCESIDPAPGHRSPIAPGRQYLRVNVQPQGAGGLNRWRHVRLCRACAIAYGLAESLTPGGA